MRLNLPLWAIPLIYVLVSLIIAIAFPRIEHEYLAEYAHGMSVSSSQAFLSSVASGMMALTAIVFSISFLIVQFSASAYSKRLVMLFGQDPILFNALGMCFATFLYALAVLFYVDRNGDGKVPYFSILIVNVLLVSSVTLLALLVHRMTQLQITHVLRIVGDKGRQVIEQTFPAARHRADIDAKALRQQAERLRSGTVLQSIRYSGEPRAVADFDIPALVGLAADAGVAIVVECAVGDTVGEGALLARTFGTGKAISETALLQAIHLAWDRTFEQDPKYPLRLLVDTAIMALSPAINDPTTAVQAIDQIEDLLHRLGRRNFDIGNIKNAKGELCISFSNPTWEDYLSLAFDEIRLCGKDSIQVLRRLRAALNDIAGSLNDVERADAVRTYLRHVDDGISHSNLDELDRNSAFQGDRQGLGVSRRSNR